MSIRFFMFYAYICSLRVQVVNRTRGHDRHAPPNDCGTVRTRPSTTGANQGRSTEQDLDSKDFERATIDYRPDEVLFAVDLDFSLIDDNFLTSPTVWPEEVFSR